MCPIFIQGSGSPTGKTHSFLPLPLALCTVSAAVAEPIMWQLKGKALRGTGPRFTSNEMLLVDGRELDGSDTAIQKKDAVNRPQWKSK